MTRDAMALNDTREDLLSLSLSLSLSFSERWPPGRLQAFAQEALRGFQSPANPFICLPLIYDLILTVFSMQMQGAGVGCGGSSEIYIM